MNKGTILYLLDTLQTGGAEKSLLEITSRFQHFKPVFVTLFAGRHDLLSDYEAAGIEVIRLGLPVSNKFKDLAKYVDKVVSDQNAVIVHSSIFRSDMTARHLKSKVKIVNSLVNNSYRKRRYDGLAWKGKLSLLAVQLLDRFSIGRIDLMIANSQVLVDSHRKTIGLNPSKTVVIHRGRPIPIEAKALPTAHCPLPTAHWLCVGRLIERKGHKDLLPAFAQLLRTRPNDRLILAGDGEYRGEVEKEIKRLEIGDSVDLLGTVSNVQELLEKADFFVFPSYFEGLPGSIIEAMLTKIPIICSDIPENKECLKEGMCFFHRVGDKEDLFDKMEKALILEDWQERTERAFDYASEHFEIGKIARRYEDVYSNLLKECVEL
ncbi:MAG: glycosyltransferase [Algoriphagus sp.]|uniref:glycosyltransferase n=1 Tax=Algoriphagus sp. TaxID=1872435 RepID=UPI002639EA29|nr:glycosyltransferase [Algoriphagus sp.]MDG1277531.1 glycosyltransferase [Algoriphagus sp.]